MACKRSPVRSRYSPPLAQIRVTNTVDFKSKSTVFLCLSASKFISILQILCKIKVEVHMDLVSAINFYPADEHQQNIKFALSGVSIPHRWPRRSGSEILGSPVQTGAALHCGTVPRSWQKLSVQSWMVWCRPAARCCPPAC